MVVNCLSSILAIGVSNYSHQDAAPKPAGPALAPSPTLTPTTAAGTTATVPTAAAPAPASAAVASCSHLLLSAHEELLHSLVILIRQPHMRRSVPGTRVWTPNTFTLSVGNPGTEGDSSAYTWLSGSTGSNICHSVYSAVVRYNQAIRPEKRYRAPVSAGGICKAQEPILAPFLVQREAVRKEKEVAYVRAWNLLKQQQQQEVKRIKAVSIELDVQQEPSLEEVAEESALMVPRIPAVSGNNGIIIEGSGGDIPVVEAIKIGVSTVCVCVAPSIQFLADSYTLSTAGIVNIVVPAPHTFLAKCAFMSLDVQ